MASLLDTVLTSLLQRPSNPLRALSAYFNKVNLNQFERDTGQNCVTLRNYIAEHVDRVREETDCDEMKLQDRGDFLGYLLINFKDDTSTIVDMIIEFFLAATQTTVSLTLNVFHHLI